MTNGKKPLSTDHSRERSRGPISRQTAGYVVFLHRAGICGSPSPRPPDLPLRRAVSGADSTIVGKHGKAPNTLEAQKTAQTPTDIETDGSTDHRTPQTRGAGRFTAQNRGAVLRAVPKSNSTCANAALVAEEYDGDGRHHTIANRV